MTTVNITPDERSPSRGLRIGFWVCIVIAVAVVVRRVVVLASPVPPGPSSSPSPQAALDVVFASHAVLTLAHILPALAFVLVAPAFYLRPTRYSLWPSRLLLVLGFAVGITAYAMSVHSIGGWMERSAVLLFNSLFLFCLYCAATYMIRGDAGEHRRWMTRSVAILLGIATTRPVMGIFFATSRLTHLQPRQFFGIAFWIGFSVNTVAIELWLRRGRDGSSLATLRPGP